MNTSLYRHFAVDGSLLYVGISLSWPARTKAHARKSQWFDQVAKVEIESFPTREAALVAEREAIKAERPKFNVVHNREVPSKSSKRSQESAPQKYDGWVDPIFDVVKGPNAIADARRQIIRKLSARLRSVEAFETDLALAVAYASHFPSEKSRQILDEIAVERGVRA